MEDVLSQPGTRLPGERRHHNRATARADGVAIGEDLLAELRRRASM